MVPGTEYRYIGLLVPISGPNSGQLYEYSYKECSDLIVSMDQTLIVLLIHADPCGVRLSHDAGTNCHHGFKLR